MQTMWHGALRQAAKPRRLKYSIRASGHGRLNVNFIRYRDTDDRKAKHGYRREQLHPSGKGGAYDLQKTVADFKGEYEIAPNEWCSIVVEAEGGEAFVEFVSVEACEK